MKRPLGMSPVLLVILCIAIVFAGLAYGYLYLIKPLNEDISTMKTKINNNQLQLQIKQNQMKIAQGLDIDALLANVPNDKDFAPYLILLEDMAKDSKCKITNITPGEMEKESDPTSSDQTTTSTNSTSTSSSGTPSSTYTLDVNAKSFSAMQAFIHKLESSERITYLNALHFTGENAINFSVTLSIFYDTSMKNLSE